MPASASAAPRRDPRLDFFRGGALLIIFVAHFRGDWLADYIPARFGLSDAADLFVFCSGYAAAIAFGGTFIRHGFLIGLARIALRCWQLYIAHIALFFAAVAACLGLSGAGSDSYLRTLGLDTFFADAPAALYGLATLHYVPHYFDILPLYMVVLAMVPIAMLLARVSPVLAIAASIGLYVASWSLHLNFSADPFSDTRWYFNPLCWQLIFFTGFAFSRGWLKAPLQSRAVTGASLAFVVLCIATSSPSLFAVLPPLSGVSAFFVATADKTNLDLFQYAHFLATAQLAIVLLAGRERVLLRSWRRPIVKCGQQALSVFLSGMLLSHVFSILLVRTGNSVAAQIVLNTLGFASLIGIAYTVAWFKSAPWKRPPEKRPAVSLQRASAPLAPAE